MKCILLLLGTIIIIGCSREQRLQSLMVEAEKEFVDTNFREAIRIYTKVIKDYPKAEMAFLNRAKCFYNLRQYKDALADLNLLMQHKSPPGPGITYEMSRESAIMPYEKKLIVHYREVLLERAHIYYQLDSLQKSFDDFRELLSMGHNQSECYEWMAIIYFDSGMKKEGCEFIEKAYAAGNYNLRYKYRQECP